ncbi:MAG: tetratricopeptide repeat protein (plasmid) [Leptolyngbya sp. BL-A-14]
MMMTTAALELALQQYAIALKALAQFTHSPTYPPSSPESSTTESISASSTDPSLLSSLVLDVLTARDYVQAVLENIPITEIPIAFNSNLDHLSQLDKTLRSQANVITSLPQFTDWRASLAPNKKAWWWSLKAPKQHWSDRFDAVWSTISITALTISLGLLGDIAPRFLTGGPDSFAAIAVSAQSILTLIAAGGTLTEAGREGLKHTLKTIRLPEKYWHELGAVGALLLMISFFGLRQSLPWIATHFYTDPAIKSRTNGDWGTAESQFKRAIQLNADDAQAQFNLGNLYEDLQLLDQARPQYQRAFQGGVMAAANNLARLNILKKDYGAAVSLLLKALATEKQKPLEPKVKHAVLKNLGWARFEQKNYPEADAKLRDAIDLESTTQFKPDEIADSHCLLAQVMEAQSAKKDALTEWKICSDNANPTIQEQDRWAVIAQERLLPQETRK